MGISTSSPLLSSLLISSSFLLKQTKKNLTQRRTYACMQYLHSIHPFIRPDQPSFQSINQSIPHHSQPPSHPARPPQPQAETPQTPTSVSPPSSTRHTPFSTPHNHPASTPPPHRPANAATGAQCCPFPFRASSRSRPSRSGAGGAC